MTSLTIPSPSTTCLKQTQPTHTDYAKGLFETGLFSDCTIYSRHRTWHLHRAILAQRCDFFRACFTNNFRESFRGEHDVVEVNLHEDDPDTIDRMLRWLYTLEYPSLETDTCENNALSPTFWTSELTLSTTSEKYNLTALTLLASDSICSTAANHSKPSLTPSNPTTSTFPQFNNFILMLESLYTDITSTTPCIRTLQDRLLSISAMTIAAQATTHEHLAELVTSVPEFAGDLVQALRRTVEACKVDEKEKEAKEERLGYRSGSESEGSVVSDCMRPRTGRVYIPMNEDSDED